MSEDERALQVIEDVLIRHVLARQTGSIKFGSPELAAQEILSRLRMMEWKS